MLVERPSVAGLTPAKENVLPNANAKRKTNFAISLARLSGWMELLMFVDCPRCLLFATSWHRRPTSSYVGFPCVKRSPLRRQKELERLAGLTAAAAVFNRKTDVLERNSFCQRRRAALWDTSKRARLFMFFARRILNRMLSFSDFIAI